MIVHDLKILPEYFELVKNGYKDFEIRKNDRNYKIGDAVRLCEYDADKGEYTGNEIFSPIKYIFYGTGEYGVAEGYCIIGLMPSVPTSYTTKANSSYRILSEKR